MWAMFALIAVCFIAIVLAARKDARLTKSIEASKPVTNEYIEQELEECEKVSQA